MKKLAKNLTSLVICGMLSLGVANTVAYAQQENAQTSERTDNDDDQDWGWIGLIGLAGLLGLRRRDPVVERRDR